MRFSDFEEINDLLEAEYLVGYFGIRNVRISATNLFGSQLIGSGSNGFIPVFSDEKVLESSIIYIDGSNVSIGTTVDTGYKLFVDSGSLADGLYVTSQRTGLKIESTGLNENIVVFSGQEGDVFVIPTNTGASVVSLRKIVHPDATAASESATLGQVNSNIETTAQELQGEINLRVAYEDVGVPLGVAELDANGKIIISQIPDSILGQVSYQGVWNVSTNTPTLEIPPASTTKGDYYIVSGVGTFSGIEFQDGDWIISKGDRWEKVDNTDAVVSVFGRIGAIQAVEADYQAFYPKLSESYVNPTWISSLDWNKITNSPDFLLENQTITLSGDVTGSGKTAISTSISANAVTNEKIRQSAGLSVIGRSVSTSGNVSDITATQEGHVLRRSNGSLSFGLLTDVSISDLSWNKITGTPTTILGYGITDAYTKTETDNIVAGYVPYTGAAANVNLGAFGIIANQFSVPGGSANQFLKANGSLDSTSYVPSTRSVSAGTGLTGGGNLSADRTISFDTVFGDNRYLAPLAGYVPYTGATTNVDLGNFRLVADSLKLKPTPNTVPVDQGSLYWDVDDNVIAVVLNGTVQKVGEDSFFAVENKTGSTILKGTNVRFAGTLGASGKLLIAPFIADGSTPSSFYMGVTSEDIPNDGAGKVYQFGRIRGIDTSMYSEGDILYASTTIAGGFQTTVPTAPNNIIQVAAVITSHANVGTIMVRPTIGSNINKDEGVKITSGSTGDILQLQSNGLFENVTKAEYLAGTSSQFVKGDGSLDSTSYKPDFTENTAFNKNFGTSSGTVAEGDDPRILNGQTAFGWGNHALAGYALASSLSNYQLLSEKGQANGYTPLDANGKVPLIYINDVILGQVRYIGTWNAATNTPTLPDPTTVKGNYYVATNSGTQFGKDFNTGDWVISDGTIWDKVDNTDSVATVFGRIGNILAVESDYQAFYPRLSQVYTNPSWIGSLPWTKITGTPTNLSGYGITDAYTQAQINNFFSGSTGITGYNKSNWDAAFSWGNHALAGYLTSNQTITLSGVVTGSGNTAITTSIANGAISNAMLANSSFHVGTTLISLGRASAGQTLTGVSIDGNAGTVGTISANRIVYGGAGSRQGVTQISDWNQTTFPDAVFLSSENSTANAPTTDFTYGVQTSFHRGAPEYRTQFVTSLYGNNVYWLRQFRDTAGWSSWVQAIHSGNFNSYSPTLTGGGASGTWGINITGNAATITSQANSATITASTGVNASQIVQRDVNGYIYANHINFNTTESENPPISSFITSNGDGWSRKSSLAHVRNQLGNYGGWITGLSFNGLSDKTGGTGTYQTSGDFRAPIFYDSNDTFYQLDPNGNSRLFNLGLGGVTPDARLSVGGDTHISGYLYQGGTAGVINSWGSRTLVSSGNYVSNARSFRFDNVGYGSSWALDINSSGNVIASVDMRAPIFYDSNNTTYYADPNGISNMYGIAIRGDQSQFDTSNQIFFWGGGNTTTSAIGFKNSGGNFQNPTGSGDGYNTYLTMDTPGRGWVFREGIGGANFGAAYTSGWILNNGNWQSNASMRSPIFYDSNDTSFYLDPATTSILNSVVVRFGGNVLLDPGWGFYGFPGLNADSYFGAPIMGFTYSNNAPFSGQLISFGAGGYNLQLNNSYGGTGGGLAYRARNGDNSTWNPWRYPAIYGFNANGGGDLFATIYYDQNNTAFFADPNGRSRLSSIDYGDGGFFFAGGDWGWRHNTPFGWIQFGPANTSHAHIYTDRSNFYFNAQLQVNGGSLINTTDIQANIFYDRQNTGYYVDPFSTSNLNILYAGETYSSGWFRNLNSNTGLYNQVTTQHWSSNTNGYWDASSTTSVSSIRFFTGGHVSALRGYVYADVNNQIGFLNSAGNWSLRVDNSGNTTATGDVTAYSDGRVKENVNTLENALHKITLLRGVSYNRIDSNDKRKKIGVIAQEVLKVVPEVVGKDVDGMYNVAYGNLVGLLIEAIKEQQKQIEELKTLIK